MPFSFKEDEPLPNAEYIEDFRKSAHAAVDWIADYLGHIREYPVLPRVAPGDLIDALPHSGPDEGEPYTDIMRDFANVVMPAVTHWNHPGFLAYFGCTGSAPAIIGEMLSAALNTNGLHWKTSPAVAELERVTLDWLRQWMGLSDDYFGIIYDTASVSSMHAIAAAREMADPDARTNGCLPRLTIYTSEQSHSSIEKGAITLGIGQRNVRKIGCDSEFRMRPLALRAAIEHDVKAGMKPFCIVATVGTTSTTSVDPVPAIADIADEFNCWLHIDSAYAGSAAVCPEFQWIFKGAERAHSIVVNPHKWLFTPVDLSAFFTRKPDVLRRAFSLIPEYLRPQEDPRAINYMDYGVPLGRRFRSLKFWFVMRYFGREGLQRLIRSHVSMAQEFAGWVDANPQFERVAPVPFSVVCFRFKGSDEQNHAILEAVNDTGKVFLSHTSLNGQYVMRVAIGNLGTTREDVKLAWELIQEGSRQYFVASSQ
jgi:aromatic-L-amino-acid/L-tryptophan decarboxylase